MNRLKMNDQESMDKEIKSLEEFQDTHLPHRRYPLNKYSTNE